MITYRKYSEPDDYETVKEMMISHEGDNFPRNLGGIAVVAEENEKIVGFVWALVAKGSESAYINYFLVHRDYRSRLDIGHMIMFNLIGMLDRAGIRRIHGVILGDSGYEVSLARTFQNIGMNVKPAKYMVVGNTNDILSGMLRRYHGRRENHANHYAS